MEMLINEKNFIVCSIFVIGVTALLGGMFEYEDLKFKEIEYHPQPATIQYTKLVDCFKVEGVLMNGTGCQ